LNIESHFSNVSVISESMDRHEEAVAAIASSVRDFHQRGVKFRIYHGSTNSTRRLKWKRSEVVDTSGLTHVIKVDTERNIVIVEPNVPFDKLIEATMAHNLIPPVVPEFPGITVGGAAVGTAGESSSFKFGFVDANLERVQVVIANGTVVFASKDENAELFGGIPSSFGTLGVITLIEMRLIPAKKYVALTYHPVSSFSEAVGKTVSFSKDQDIDFLDSIIFSRSKAAIMTGIFTDNASGQNIQRFSRARDQWFYLHAKRALSTTGELKTDIVPLADYLFRYDRGAFWTGRLAFRYFIIAPFDRFSRWCLDWFMHTRVMYQALHESGMSNSYVIQDLAVPVDCAEDFLNWVNSNLEIYPLWLCPLVQRPTGVMSPRVPVPLQGEQDSDSSAPEMKKPEVMLNIGVWGCGPRDREEFIAINRKLEKTVTDLGGIKWLYAQTYYTEEEFWNIYDKEAYNAIREKYGATKMPTVFDKVKVDVETERKARAEAARPQRMKNYLKEVWPVRGVYAIWRVVVAREYLLEKKKSRKME
jgi:delta24-sterol reductase